MRTEFENPFGRSVMKILSVLIIAGIVMTSVNAGAYSTVPRALDYGVKEYGVSGAYRHVSKDEDHFLDLALRAGMMTGAGMEVEAELGWNRLWREDYSSNEISFAGNFCYNISTYAMWSPFFLGGLGLIYDRWSIHSDTETETDLLIQFGAGTKLFVTDHAAVRIEYRYKIRKADADDINTHYILMGISAFLP